ncbi:MAG: hypothetical protein ACR2F5_01740 [Candidatus Limnocylindria bacterium]
MSRTIERAAGILLLAVGVAVLASGPLVDFVGGFGIGDEVWRWWPVILIGLSLFFLGPALLGRRPNRRIRAGMAIPGFFLAGVGSVLLYTSLSDRWDAWSYLWSVVPFSLGLGMYAAGWIADAPAFKWIGAAIAVGGAVGYLVFATAFGGEGFRLIAALAILAFGVVLVMGGLGERLSRKSPGT